MKKLVYLFVSLFLIVIAAENTSAQYNESASANASAVIITPIDITKAADLSFGNIIASASEGTVTVNFENTRTNAGGASFPSIDGTITSAEFEATGFANSTYTITLPADEAVKLSGTGTDMNLINFVHNAEQQLSADGKETFQVGATLKVNANQAAGTYNGSFNVIVNYN